ncbi:MAG: MFS transporter, partial [Polyangiaceae bacterium]
PGVLPKHLFHFYVAAFFTIMLAVTFVGLLPFVFQKFLNLPIRENGSASAQVGFVGEAVLLALVGVWGIWSDRIGRRAVYAIGFVVMAIGFAVVPMARSLTALMGARAIFAAGIAATTAMLATLAADYVVNDSRGKANAIMGVMNGFGAMAAALGMAKLPSVFIKAGQDGISAGANTAYIAAGLCVVVALILQLGLKDKGGEHQSDERVPFFKMASESVRAAKEDPGVVLCYLSAFVSRADLAVAGTFFPLWMTTHYAEQLTKAGVAPSLLGGLMDEAASRGIKDGGILVAIAGGCGLLFAPVIGILCDRINRVHALVIGLSMNVIGYGLTFFVIDPSSVLMKVAAAIIGFGQVGGVISSQVLIQQQAPAKFRGSVIGAFGACGAAGIMFCLFAGGKLFDAWRGAGPFVLLAALNFVVIAFAWMMKARIAAPAESADAMLMKR